MESLVLARRNNKKKRKCIELTPERLSAITLAATELEYELITENYRLPYANNASNALEVLKEIIRVGNE